MVLAAPHLSQPDSLQGHRGIASINPWAGDYPANFQSYAVPSSISLGLQQFQQNPDNQDLLQLASSYSDIFYLSSMNYLAGLQNAQAGFGNTSPLFAAPAPISIANFDTDSFAATTPAWNFQDIQKNLPKTNLAAQLMNQFPGAISNTVMTSGSPVEQALKMNATAPAARANLMAIPASSKSIPAF